ncbi:hypothetical protein ES703_59018 [subsurface metagenome]
MRGYGLSGHLITRRLRAEMVTKREKMLLLRIGALIRGNFSGYPVDDRDVQYWIHRVVNGDLDELDALLKKVEKAEGFC